MLEKEGQMMAAVLAGGILLLGAVAAVHILRLSRKKEVSRLFDVLSSAMNDIFLMLGSDMQSVKYISPNVERLLGITTAAVRSDMRVISRALAEPCGDDWMEELAALSLNMHIERNREYVHQRTGERRWCREAFYHVNLHGADRFILIFSDRTMELRTNQKLREALESAQSASEAKSHFLAGISRDIRTPMNIIMGYADLLEKDADRPERFPEYAGKIASCSTQLLSLVSDILNMSRIEGGRVSLNIGEFRIRELAQELGGMILPQAKAKQQEFRIEVSEEVPDILTGDRLCISRMLLHLLDNAVMYTPERGHICCEISLLERTPQKVRVQYTVKDDGIGISSAFQKKIFEPFTRASHPATDGIQGTGLGMAITRNMVDLMGGTISLESAPGKGSTFTVVLESELPDQEESPAGGSSAGQEGAGADALAGMLFLVAEDNELNAEILMELLRMEGAACELVGNGQEAVERFERSAPGYYDVILMDVRMPVMNGYEAVRRIRAGSHPDAAGIPIVAMTASAFSRDVRDAMEAGMNAHIARPMNMEMLRHTIKKLGNPRAGAGITG